MKKIEKIFLLTIGVVALFAAVFFSNTRVQAYDNLQQSATAYEKSNKLKMASGSFNFKGSSKDTVVLHGAGFDTGDVSTINGFVRIKVGSISRTYPFEGTVPGLYSKNFGSWYLPGWKTATLESYYINYSDGSKSDVIFPPLITITNNY